MPCPRSAASVATPMAKARAKTQAKSGSKTKAKSKKLALKRKPAVKVKAAKKPVARKARAKKPVARKKVVVVKAAPKNVKAPAKKVPTRIIPKATPVSPPRKPLPPAVDRALAQADVEGLISRLPPPVQPVVKTLRRLVLEAAPEASELLDDGSPAYFANGVFARIIPSEREVLVKFLRGDDLPSASELSDGAISLTSVEELKETVLRKLVREAVMLNLSMPPPARA